MMKHLTPFAAACAAILVLTTTSCTTDAKPPAPYTKEALQRLAEAGKTITIKELNPGIQAFLDYCTAIYDKAGYSFDKSLIKMADDVGKQDYAKIRAKLNEETAFRITSGCARQLLALEKDGNLKTHLQPQTYQALMKLADATKGQGGL